MRQRYNGQPFKSTYTVGREMGISDETVRTIENRALDAIAHCLDLETAGQVITPMRLAKSFRQPVASLIGQGLAAVGRAARADNRERLRLSSAAIRPRAFLDWARERCSTPRRIELART